MAKSLALDVSDIRSVTDSAQCKDTRGAAEEDEGPDGADSQRQRGRGYADANAYQKLVDRLQKLREERDLNAAFEVGFEDVRQGKVKPARLALKYRGR